MSKKILVVGILFSLTLSMMITQEANALTNWPGQYSRTTASLDPSRVCGSHICQAGENHKWSHAISTSQRQGSIKAADSFNGMVIMQQLVINLLAKSNQGNSTITSHVMSTMSSTNFNATGSK